MHAILARQVWKGDGAVRKQEAPDRKEKKEINKQRLSLGRLPLKRDCGTPHRLIIIRTNFY